MRVCEDALAPYGYSHKTCQSIPIVDRNACYFIQKTCSLVLTYRPNDRRQQNRKWIRYRKVRPDAIGLEIKFHDIVLLRSSMKYFTCTYEIDAFVLDCFIIDSKRFVKLSF